MMPFKYSLLLVLILLCSCNQKQNDKNMKDQTTKVVFLHHSTGYGVWKGNPDKILSKIDKRSHVEKLFNQHNKSNKTNYSITERSFPSREPYGWKNYPFDYYNIWVKNGERKNFMDEPNLDTLTKQYNVVIFKHCFPVSDILDEEGDPSIDSERKTLGNYKLQYQAIGEKLRSYPETKFILWTGAALTKETTTEQNAERAKQFSTWVKEVWDQPNDNIFIWDFRELEVEGGLYLKPEFANTQNDSHPNKIFNKRVANLFVKRVIDIIETNGTKTSLTGEKI